MMQPMPRVPPFDRPATYEDLAALPDTLVAEIVDGELHASRGRRRLTRGRRHRWASGSADRSTMA